MTNIKVNDYLKNIPLGEPLPSLPHAASVSLPKWNDVVGYEECEPRVINSLKAGYPRFVYQPLIRELFKKYEEKFVKGGDFCITLPSQKAADKCLSYVKEKCGATGRLEKADGIYIACLPEKARKTAKEFWQHSGYIISTRHAEAILKGAARKNADKEKAEIKSRIAKLAGAKTEDVYTFACGMEAILTVFESLKVITPGCKTIQLGFPYVDTLKIQEKFGVGNHFLKYDDERDLEAVANIISKEKIAAVFCEFPGNPLLQSIELEKLSAILRPKNIPLVVDDTLATWANVDFKGYADVTVTSLTKFFSGGGDVLGGAAVLNAKSPLYSKVKEKIDDYYEDLTFSDDAIALEENSRDFSDRIKKINLSAEKLCDFLNTHPKVAKVYYPKFVTRQVYDKYKKKGGGYGGLFSLTLKNPKDAPIFYDRLEVAKGPGLGTNFTLACPYTVIAHYYEMEMTAKFGVSPDLIRISVGLEDADKLIDKFKTALE